MTAGPAPARPVRSAATSEEGWRSLRLLAERVLPALGG
jgi:hypothetical protein